MLVAVANGERNSFGIQCNQRHQYNGDSRGYEIGYIIEPGGKLAEVLVALVAIGYRWSPAC